MTPYEAFVLVKGILLIALYWLPTLLSIFTRDPHPQMVAIWNFLIGWTGIGWIWLLWAVWRRRRSA